MFDDRSVDLIAFLGVERGVQGLGERLVEPRKQVAVAVQGHRDRRVPKPVLDRLGMRPRRDEKRGARVTQIVEAQPVKLWR
jgi:hypothetical protein